MSKRKTLRRLSSAALLSLAMYSQTMSPGWVKEVKAFETTNQVRIERREEVRRKLNEFSIGRGEVKNVSGNTLVVTDKKDNKDFNVVVDEKTKLIGKSLGKILINDIKVGHKVVIEGKIENGDSSTIKAKSVIDLSLEIRSGQFRGVVSEVNSDSLVMKVRGGKSIKVMLGSAELTDRTGKWVGITQVIVGDVIKVKGLYNGDENILTNVTSIKDSSLPRK